MTTPKKRQLSLYAEALDKIRARGDVARDMLTPPRTYQRLEAAALQMRLILETIPLAALVTHQEHVQEVAAAFARKGPREAAKLVERVNPDYWPKPVRQVPTPEGPARDRLDTIDDGFLTRAEWQQTWGWLSSVLHARNPFKGEPDIDALAAELEDVLSRITTLLSLHWLDLPDGADPLLGMIMAEDGRAHVYEFKRHDLPEA